MKLLLALVFAPAVASAGTWHVATTGNDTSAGTEQAPWRTIQRAANAVVAGDTVIIHAGTYVGFLVGARGTESAPIRFVGDGVVAIDGAATADRDAVDIEGGSWITIEGLTVTNAARAGVSAEDCDHIVVRGNRIDHNGRWGVFSSHCEDLVVEANEVSRSGTEHGIYASNSADRPVIRNNLVWSNGGCGIHINGDINFGGDGVISGAVVEGNVIRDNGLLGGSGINGDGITGAVIRNNVLDGNHASGISLYRIDGGAPSTGNQVINNTVRMAAGSRWALNIQDGSSGNTVRNNILLNGSGAINACASCVVGMVSDHNAVGGGFMVDGVMADLADWRSRTGNDLASFGASETELFGNELELRATSPAIDQGVADGAPAVDVLGMLRPQGAGIDLGAYEYCGGCVEPPGGGSGGSEPGVDMPVDPEEASHGGCSTGGGVGWLAGIGVLLAVRRRARSR